MKKNKTKVEWLNNTFNKEDDWITVAYILAGEIDDFNKEISEKLNNFKRK